MNTTLIIHSITRWAILIFGLWALINGVKGLLHKKPFSKKDKLSGLLFMIFCDIQLLLGIILFISNGWYDRLKIGMKVIMKNPIDRFFIFEHGFMMILAWIIVHIGYRSVKKANELAKHKKMVVYFGIALILILISIPWPFRTDGIQRPLLPQF